MCRPVRAHPRPHVADRQPLRRTPFPCPLRANKAHVDAVVAAQNSSHAEGHDYDKGSPHLRHDHLRGMVEQRLERLVRDSIERTGVCRIVEIGTGHGTFTRCLLDAGARITVTEASSASAKRLRADFGTSDRVEVIFDESGEGILERGGWTASAG